MKSKYIKYQIVQTPLLVLFMLLMVSCDYLDVVPDNIATIDYAFRNRTVAENYLYGCYSYRPAIGEISSDPAMSGSDEIWQDYGFRNYSWEGTKIRRGLQNVSSPILNLWDGNRSLWTGIRDCNIFLENIDKVRDIQYTERMRWIAEVKFLKAYYHYCMMKRYGPIPIIDENLPASAGVDEVKVYREPIDEVVNYIVNLMTEVVEDLPRANMIIKGTEDGRIDQCIALTMKAEVLLFAASPLFNGNADYASMVDKRNIQLFPQTYEPEKWAKAAQACKEAIDACHDQGKELYDLVETLTVSENEVFQLQTTYRQAICDRWNKELIWGGTNNNCGLLARCAAPRLVRLESARMSDVTGELAPELKFVNMYYSSNGVPINEDNTWLANNWYQDRYEIRPEASWGNEIYFVKEGEHTVNMHYNREPRFYASIGFDKGIYFGSGYTQFSEVKYADFLNLGVSGYIGGLENTGTGYCAKKMHSFKDAQQTNWVTWEYFPFPILRLADLYLMYAEALNEADGPSDEIFYYLDLIRARAGLDGVVSSWKTHSSIPDKPESIQGRRSIIHQERAIELAFEAKRFWDIRRWKEIGVLNETPEGWNLQGETPEDFYNVVSLPRTSLEFRVKDYFWPIMESSLYVNNNLVQNYGW